jgi:uncharacterized protein (DUF433 family)
MAQPQPVSYPRIVRNPRILEGEPTIAGTRVSVRIIVQTLQQDQDMALVLKAFPMLDRAAIEEAMAFYEANRAEIDRYIQENEDDDD